MIKKIIFLNIMLLTTLLLTATDWTVLVYMAADNGLYQYGLEDIEQMEESEFCNNANIIVQIDGPEWADDPLAYRYKIGYHPEPGIQSRKISSLGEIDSGDYLTLKSFVNWGFDKYKSNNKSLVVWSHGDGWIKGIQDPSKYIATDNESNNFISMSLHQMQQAISSQHVDILIYDACTLQSIENLAELNGYADYIIGSEETVSAKGFPYNEMFDYWDSQSSIDSIAVNIPLIYVDSYRPGNSQNSGYSLRKTTCSTAKMDNWSNFEEALNSFFVKWSTQPKLFTEAREEIFEFNHLEVDVDIMELLQYVEQNTTDLELKADTSELLELLFSVFISHDSAAFSYKVGTATIWLPDTPEKFSSLWGIYSNLYFAQDGYPFFLNQYLGPDELAPQSFEILDSTLINETLYLEWENKNDPDTLSYDVVVEFEDGELLIQEELNTNKTTLSISQNGFVYVLARDKAGNRTKSVQKVFQYKQESNRAYFAPNPIRNINNAYLVIYLPNRTSNLAKLSIYSISGKLIARDKIDLSSENENRIKLNTFISNSISSGVYYAIIDNGQNRIKTKFSIIK